MIDLLMAFIWGLLVGLSPIELFSGWWWVFILAPTAFSIVKKIEVN